MERLCSELSGQVGENAASIGNNFKAAETLELYFAKANLGEYSDPALRYAFLLKQAPRLPRRTSPLRSEKAAKLKPLSGVDKIREELKKTDDAFTLSAKFGTPRFRQIKDLSGSLKRAESGSLILKNFPHHCVFGFAENFVSLGKTSTLRFAACLNRTERSFGALEYYKGLL